MSARDTEWGSDIIPNLCPMACDLFATLELGDGQGFFQLSRCRILQSLLNYWGLTKDFWKGETVCLPGASAGPCQRPLQAGWSSSTAKFPSGVPVPVTRMRAGLFHALGGISELEGIKEVHFTNEESKTGQ